MADPVTDLAMTGASTIVTAMATDAWQVVRDGVVRLLRGHGRPSPAIEAQLDEDAGLVATDEDPDEARRDLATGWRRRLARLLAEHPEAAEELKALIEQAGEAAPRARQVWVQTNVAREHGRVFGVQGGDMHIHPAPTQSAQQAVPERGAGTCPGPSPDGDAGARS